MTTVVLPAPRTWRLAAMAAGLSACTTMHGRYERAVRAEAARQPRVADTLVSAQDLERLPAPVATYLRRAGVVGRPRVHDFVVTMDAELWRPGAAAPMRTVVEQHSFVDRPARFFYLRTTMFGLPVRGLHAYAGTDASMDIRAAGLVTVVHAGGAAFHRAETVTLLNDLCIMAPAALVDPRLTWTPRTDTTADVRFTTGTVSVAATLVFNAQGDLVDFISDDRHALPDDGTRWTTPLGAYRAFGDVRLASEGEAIWHYPDKPSFRYGRFVLRSVRYNTGQDTRVIPTTAP